MSDVVPFTDSEARLFDRLRAFRRQAKAMAALLKFTDGQAQNAPRSGNVVCSRCGLELADHPEAPGFPYLTVTCHGELVKL